jgi:hypothetical protein
MGWLDRYVHWWARTAFWPLYMLNFRSYTWDKPTSSNWKKVKAINKDSVWTHEYGWTNLTTYLVFHTTERRHYISSEIWYGGKTLYFMQHWPRPLNMLEKNKLIEHTKTEVCKKLYEKEKLFQTSSHSY